MDGDRLSGEDPRDVLSALGRPYSSDILAATDTARSAQELSDELDIPIATCYRRVDELAERGLLTTHPTEDTQGTTTYRRSVDGLSVAFHDGLSVSSVRPSKVQQTLDRIWGRS